jgi:hypothetical protein
MPVVIDMGMGIIDKFEIDMGICIIVIGVPLMVSIIDIGGATAQCQYRHCERGQQRQGMACVFV